MSIPSTPVTAQAASPPDATTTRKLLAHPAHTVFFVALVLLFSFLGSRPSAEASRRAHGKAVLYATTIAWEWVMVGIVYLGVRRRAVTLGQLIGGRWRSASDALQDAALAAALWFIAIMAVGITKAALGMIHIDPGANLREAQETARALDFLIPQSRLEIGLYTLLAMTAGFCEEIIFRGYLLQQMAAITGSGAAAIMLQAALFGTAHGYQGWKLMVVLTSFGACFGIFAHWRKSLVPGMITHAWQDLFSGLAIRFLGKMLHA